MQNSNIDGHTAHWYAAWWSAVIEPGDIHAAVIRKSLGDEAAIAWAMAPESSPLPPQCYSAHNSYFTDQDWKKAHERWHHRAQLAQPDEDFGVMEGVGGTFIIPTDPQWPHTLDDLGEEKPVGLWVRGKIPTQTACSIVGARASTRYGNINAYELAAGLSARGYAVISGGAFGIDIAAHRGALSEQKPTVAVMAGGIAQLYPSSHEQDFQQIIEVGGAIISEVPPMWRPARWRFLGRNRIIAALGRVTIVMEAGLRSGALATARTALKIGRDVGAFPGLVTSEMSKGCHELIRNGAVLIRNVSDVAELLEPYAIGQDVPLFGDPVEVDQGVDHLPYEQRRIWEALPKQRAASLERIVMESGLARREVYAAIAALELQGWVVNDRNGWKRVAK